MQPVYILDTFLCKSLVSYRQLTFITETLEKLLVKSCAKFDLLFVNIQCVTACSLVKLNLSLNCCIY